MRPIEIKQDEIEKLVVDCVVNAANSGLRQGSGVCGAIFSAAGASALQAACNKIGGCATGSAVVTPAFKLPAKYIIHAVGPNFTHDDSEEATELLRSAYISAMEQVRVLGCHSVAFPLISSGSFRGNMSNSALWTVAIGAVRDWLEAYPDYEIKVYFACRGYSLVGSGREVLLSPPPIRPLTGGKSAAPDYFVFPGPKGENDCFSMLRREKITAEGIEYQSCIQYLLAKKALMAGDIEHYYLIMNQPDPALCIELGTGIRNADRERWHAAREEIAYNINRAKITGSPELTAVLLDTGVAEIAYADERDRVFGIGLSPQSEEITDKTKWNGENMLGSILMRIRDELLKLS